MTSALATPHAAATPLRSPRVIAVWMIRTAIAPTGTAMA